jgi:molybdopterin-biosynthesis enzyme MoeA-like protein
VPEASAKMAFIPQGAGLIENRLTGAPGFIIENIYVMAGIPDIMQGMFMAILPSLKKSNPISSKQISIFAGESKIAKMFNDLQKKYPDIDMGSYPFNHEGRYATSLVLRSNAKQLLEDAFEELKTLVREYEIIA